MLCFSPITGITQSVSSPVPEPLTCAHHLRMWQERDNEPLSVYRGEARTEEPVCYLTGKFVTLCEDVQAARSRTASFQEKREWESKQPSIRSLKKRKQTAAWQIETLRCFFKWGEGPCLYLCAFAVNGGPLLFAVVLGADSRSSPGWSEVVLQNTHWHFTRITLD